MAEPTIDLRRDHAVVVPPDESRLHDHEDLGGDVPEPPEPPETGDPAVDEAMLRLAAATSEPLETQVAAFDAAHRALQDRLADVEG